MNNKYVFNGNNWIVTPGEIVVTSLDGTIPMHPAQSKKLYDQNRAKYHGMVLTTLYNAIKETVATVDKYTIVELTHNNKHYHGLASRADCDKENAVTGVAVAYHRAFEKMMQHHKTNVVDETTTHKARTQKEIWAINKFKTSAYCKGLKRFTEYTPIDGIIHKQSKLADKAISYLMACTGVELRQYDLKTVQGAKDALEEISKYGYNIYELQNTDPLNLTYVLKQYGTEITRRDIKLTLPTDTFDKIKGSSQKKTAEDYTPCWHINDPSSDKKLTELIHEAINGLKNNGNEPTEMRIKPIAAEKLMKELDIQYKRFAGACNIGIDTCFCLKYIIDPSIDVDIIIN